MTVIQSLISKVENRLTTLDARGSFKAFIKATKPDYVFNWHHLEIIDKLENFLNGDKKKLMLFVPPQHGKSEIVSRRLPAFALGKNPDLKIAACSYSGELASDFNSDVKRIIESGSYSSIFPETSLSDGKNKNTTDAKKTAKYFEIQNSKGFYKSVGVLGGLTGKTVDIGIIDDPVKDSLEAESATYRNRVWKWYVNVFRSRLHNDSKQILLMTRWHSDDLAGRILEMEPDEWEVVIYPAFATEDEKHRKKGDPLWPEKHSKEKLESTKKLQPHSFSSLYQQNPVKEGGNMVKSYWFGEYSKSKTSLYGKAKSVFDTALKANEENDNSAGLSYVFQDNLYYITDYQEGKLEFPELIEFIPSFYDENNCDFAHVENKASGISAVHAIKRNSTINIAEYKVPGVDKIARLKTKLDILKGGRVLLPRFASWKDSFVNQICGFPAVANDEAVDCLTMMIDIEETDWDLDLN